MLDSLWRDSPRLASSLLLERAHTWQCYTDPNRKKWQNKLNSSVNTFASITYELHKDMLDHYNSYLAGTYPLYLMPAFPGVLSDPLTSFYPEPILA